MELDNVFLRRLEDNINDYKLLEKWYQEEEVYLQFEQRKLTFDEVKEKYYPRTLEDANVPVYMIEYNNIPVGIIQYKLVDEENNVTGMEVVNMVLGEEGEDGRRSVTEDKDSLHTVDCDMVVMALGTSPNHEALKQSNIALTDRGLIVVENSKTSLDDVYAGGDAVTGAATVILAMEAGKKAAHEIIESLS